MHIPVFFQRLIIVTEYCRVPGVRNGNVVGQKRNLLVPDGFRMSVKCFPLHKISRNKPMTCRKGVWKNIPTCTLGNKGPHHMHETP